jgi:hypothetical protein
VEEQFQLSRKAGINISESNSLADFEREAYLNLLIKDLKNEAEAMKK